MKKELEMKLVNKFPKIFQEYHMLPRESCMGKGIECNDGWYDIINRTCKQLQWNTDNNNYPQVICQQLKEKFGSMRFYYALYEKIEPDCNKLDEDSYQYNRGIKIGTIDGIISALETQSIYVCEQCGMPGKPYTDGWHKTLCEDCKE